MHSQTIATWIRQAKQVVAFTGAGISTESGIPDFRSPGGIWATSQPVYFQDFLESEAARKEYWRQKSASHRDFFEARPNAGHLTLAKWESSGELAAVITQNIDGLHQVAGSRKILELHGTARQIGCLGCNARFDADPMVRQFLETQSVPACPKCGGLLKHTTISFGQALPEDVLQESYQLARNAEVFLALGSSLVVHPAASIPQSAKRHGAKLVIINREPTPLDGIADLVIHGSIGETLSAVSARLEMSQP